MLCRKIKKSFLSIFFKRNLQSFAVCHADFKNIRFFLRITALWKLQHMEIKGGKVGKRKELEEGSGKERKFDKMMKRWKEDKIKEQEGG